MKNNSGNTFDISLTKRSAPIKVILMDDDIPALNWYRQLLLVDPRTTVIGSTSSPDELINILKDITQSADVIVLDVEYKTSEFSSNIIQLIESIRILSPSSKILCVSQYGAPEKICSSIESGGTGYLLKEEIGNAISTAVTLLFREHFVFTPKIVDAMSCEKVSLADKQCRTLFWKVPLELTSALRETVELCILFGMRAPLASLEISKSVETIETYIRNSYYKLFPPYKKGEGLEEIMWDNLKREDEMFLLYTQPYVWEGLINSREISRYIRKE